MNVTMSKQFEDIEANLTGDEGKMEDSKSSWFRRIKKGILTSSNEKKETPEGLWAKWARATDGDAARPDLRA